MNKLYVLTYQYSDNSAFHVCAVTDNYDVASAWYAAGGSEHHVYDLILNKIADAEQGHPAWGGQK